MIHLAKRYQLLVEQRLHSATLVSARLINSTPSASAEWFATYEENDKILNCEITSLSAAAIQASARAIFEKRGLAMSDEVNGLIRHGGKTIYEGPMYIEHQASGRRQSWRGVYHSKSPPAVGERCELELEDGRKGKILIDKTSASSDQETVVIFLSDGRLG